MNKTLYIRFRKAIHLVFMDSEHLTPALSGEPIAARPLQRFAGRNAATSFGRLPLQRADPSHENPSCGPPKTCFVESKFGLGGGAQGSMPTNASVRR